MARPVRFTKSNMKPESEFKRACLKWLRYRFGKHFWSLGIAGGPYQRPGSPDVVCSLYGHFLALEFKDPGGGGRIGPRQQEVVDEIRGAGGRAYIIASWDDMEAAVQEFEPIQLTMRGR